MSKNRKLKPAAKVILAVLVLLACFGIYKGCIAKPVPLEPTPVSTTTPSKEPVTDERLLSTDEMKALVQEYNEDHEINSDVVAILKFNSDLIHQPVVQGETNDTYLRTDWKTKQYVSYGSIFMEESNDLSEDEQNIIIYGHYQYLSVNTDRTLVFTPLAQLRSSENYEANKYITLCLADEIRTYEIFAVYDCPLVDLGDGYMVTCDELEYNHINFDETYFNTYIENVKKAALYETGAESPTMSDHLLTLQTCIEQRPDAREIVLCREINRKPVSELN